MINYVTNLDVNEHSGGWSGMNHNVHDQLSQRNQVNLIQKVDPEYNLLDKVFSKGARVLGLRGIFPAFTEERLDRIKSLVEPKLDQDADLNFFHGSTPWLNVVSDKPYAIYLDACFATYLEIYLQSEQFNRAQLDRLYQKEAWFLDKAYAVFFSSQWALEETKRIYRLNGNNFHNAGLGGGFSFEGENKSEPDKYFLFVGLDFAGKGGNHVVEAFNKLLKDHWNFRLKIVGGKPPEKVLMNSNVEYIGFINKSTQDGSNQLQDLFANAYCFALPTSKDLTPLVLVEAGSVGCPVITTKSFGIPEIVKDNETGILIDAGWQSTEQLAHAMKKMCDNVGLRNQMSRNAAKHIRANFTWNKTGHVIGSIISEAHKEVVND